MLQTFTELEVIHGLVRNSGGVASAAFQVLGELESVGPHSPAVYQLCSIRIHRWADRLVFRA